MKKRLILLLVLLICLQLLISPNKARGDMLKDTTGNAIGVPSEYSGKAAEYYQLLYENDILRAWLDLIAHHEGTGEGIQSYYIMFTGKTFEGNQHPNQLICSGSLCSTAAGRYQYLYGTWSSTKSSLNLLDFSPLSQDIGAVYLIDAKRKVLNEVLAGDDASIRKALDKLSWEWASLPPQRYSGQNPRVTKETIIKELNDIYLPRAKEKKDTVWANLNQDLPPADLPEPAKGQWRLDADAVESVINSKVNGIYFLFPYLKQIFEFNLKNINADLGYASDPLIRKVKECVFDIPFECKLQEYSCTDVYAETWSCSSPGEVLPCSYWGVNGEIIDIPHTCKLIQPSDCLGEDLVNQACSQEGQILMCKNPAKTFRSCAESIITERPTFNLDYCPSDAEEKACYDNNQIWNGESCINKPSDYETSQRLKFCIETGAHVYAYDDKDDKFDKRPLNIKFALFMHTGGTKVINQEIDQYTAPSDGANDLSALCTKHNLNTILDNSVCYKEDNGRHILMTNIADVSTEVLVTPPDIEYSTSAYLYKRTTTSFAKEYDIDIAINGDSFVNDGTNPLSVVGIGFSDGKPYPDTFNKLPNQGWAVNPIANTKSIIFFKPDSPMIPGNPNRFPIITEDIIDNPAYDYTKLISESYNPPRPFLISQYLGWDPDKISNVDPEDMLQGILSGSFSVSDYYIPANLDKYISNAISGKCISVVRGQYNEKACEGNTANVGDRARTAVGLSAQRDILMIAVFEETNGGSFKDISEFLIGYGADSVLIFDGGGSTGLVIENGPRYEQGRAVANHLGFRFVEKITIPAKASAAEECSIPHFRVISEGVAAGALPTTANIDCMADKGYKTIIDLANTDTTEKGIVENSGMKYYLYQMDAETPLHPDFQNWMQEIIQITDDPNNLPVYIHCEHGAHRTGMVIGIYREERQNWSFEEAYREMLEYAYGDFPYPHLIQAVKDYSPDQGTIDIPKK